MSYEFKVGETYQTRNGHDRLIAYISPTDLVTVKGTKYRMIAIRPSKSIVGYSLDGKAIDEIGTAYDLLHPKRQIWVAVWSGGMGVSSVNTSICDTEQRAEDASRGGNPSRTRIAVLGPIDVEAEP